MAAGRAGAESEGEVKDWKWTTDPEILFRIIIALIFMLLIGVMVRG